MLSERCLCRRRDVRNVVYCEELPPCAPSFSWCAGSSETFADGSTRRVHACQDVWERRSHEVLSVRRRPPSAPSLPGVQGEVLRVTSLPKALNTCRFWRLCGTSCVMKICRRECGRVRHRWRGVQERVETKLRWRERAESVHSARGFFV